MGSEMCIRDRSGAVREVTGASKERVSRMYDELGDLGDVAATLRRCQVMLRQPAPLTARGVLATLRRIASESGPGSAGRKKNLVIGLLRAARGCEIKYLVRTLVRNMRIGANRISVLHALAAASEEHHRHRPRISPKNDADAAKKKDDEEDEGAKEVTSANADGAAGGATTTTATTAVRGVTPAMAAMQRAYSLCPSLDVLIPALVTGGVKAAAEVGVMHLGMPVKPMLASITAGVADAVGKICGGGGGGGDGLSLIHI